MITFEQFCRRLDEDWGKTSPIPKEVYADVDWRDNFKWVDLSLPSGTLWADVNVPNPDDKIGLWSWESVSKSIYKDCLPTEPQFRELCWECRKEWVKGGYKFTSKINGAELFFPAEGSGEVGFPGGLQDDGGYGYYWLRGELPRDFQFNFFSFPATAVSGWYDRYSIRLVKDKN